MKHGKAVRSWRLYLRDRNGGGPDGDDGALHAPVGARRWLPGPAGERRAPAAGAAVSTRTGTDPGLDEGSAAVLRIGRPRSGDEAAGAGLPDDALSGLVPQARREPPATDGEVIITYTPPRDCPERTEAPATVLEELRAQTRRLLAALEESRAQRDELQRLNDELQEAHRDVTELYTELSQELEETNRGVVALYSEEHQLALTLQRTFLPQSLPEVAGVHLAVRYLPAATQTEIGGDFYEAVETAAGLLLVVGDVAGHNLQAAIVMGELRHALRAYAAEDHEPHVLLERLDSLIVRHRPGWTATVCTVLLDPDGRHVRVANAGHLPPLLLPPGGEAAYVHEHGALLGIGAKQPVATVHAIAPDTRLLMVTDGLIEIRGVDILDQLGRLCTAAMEGPGEPDALCDHLVEQFGEQQVDDIIVFAARLSGRSGAGPAAGSQAEEPPGGLAAGL
jgi:serine phosphatase RsbU (regulator of sigma subunit)